MSRKCDVTENVKCQEFLTLGKNLKYHENNEIIKKEYLDILRKTVELKQYFSQI